MQRFTLIAHDRKLRTLKNALHFLCNLLLRILAILALLRLTKLRLYYKVHTASFTNHFLKEFKYLIGTRLCNDRLIHRQDQMMWLVKFHLCSTKQIIFKHTVCIQFV